jgi:hypothetical protein
VVKLVGGAEVTALPEAPVEASLRVEFGGSASSMVKAAEVSVTEIVDLQQVTTALANADGWKRGWRVVRSLWTAHNCAIAISSGKNAHFELAGKAEALKQLDLGSANAGVTVAAENNVGFSSLGKTGVVGLGLFKVSWIGGRTRFLDAGEVQVQVDEDDALESDL